MNLPCRLIRPDDFEIIDQIPGVVGVARNEQLNMFWCTKAYYRIVGYVKSSRDMMHKPLHDLIPQSAANERENILR